MLDCICAIIVISVQNACLLYFNSRANDQSCPIKKKMVHASTKDTLKKKLEGIATEIQAADKSDLDFDEVAKSVRKAK